MIYGRIPYEITQQFMEEVQPLMLSDIQYLCKLSDTEIGDFFVKAEGTIFSHLTNGKVYAERSLSSEFFGLEKRIKEFCQAAQCIDSARLLMGSPKRWTV